MPTLRSALWSLPLLVAGTAGAQSTAPAGAPAGAPAAAPGAAAAPVATETPQRPNRIGLGAAVGTGGLIPAVYVPIDFAWVRLEPEFGYLKVTSGGADASAIRAGLGLFGVAPTSPSVRASAGLRLEYFRRESGATGDGVRVAAAVGGEWAASPAVALGVEGQVGYTSASSSGSSATGVDVTAQVFLRVFLASFGQSGQPGSAGRASGASSAAPAAPAAPPKPTKPPKLQRCSTSDDCDRGVCYEGYCRQ